MKEMMQKLNVVKYATSEEKKKELLSKGFLPVGNASISDSAQGQEAKPQDQPAQKISQKIQQKSAKDNLKSNKKTQKKPEQKPEQDAGKGDVQDLQPKTDQAGDGNA